MVILTLRLKMSVGADDPITLNAKRENWFQIELSRWIGAKTLWGGGALRCRVPNHASLSKPEVSIGKVGSFQ
ncbi:tRNA-dihydrouridine synthase A [Roseobacter sp. CCS2]|nr:tRNA-dihydrouridine synthase A [Roseobacter sp. CCS2]